MITRLAPATFTWSGADFILLGGQHNNWNDGNNWVGGNVPQPGADLVFDTTAEAVERLGAVLADADLELRLRDFTAQRRRRFTAAAFCAELREIIDEFDSGDPEP